jgi:hypothetical protein
MALMMLKKIIKNNCIGILKVRILYLIIRRRYTCEMPIPIGIVRK